MKHSLSGAKSAQLTRKSLAVIEKILDEYNDWAPEYDDDGKHIINRADRPQGTVAIAAARTALDSAEKAMAAHQEENPGATAEVFEALTDEELQALVNDSETKEKSQ